MLVVLYVTIPNRQNVRIDDSTLVSVRYHEVVIDVAIIKVYLHIAMVAMRVAEVTCIVPVILMGIMVDAALNVMAEIVIVHLMTVLVELLAVKIISVMKVKLIITIRKQVGNQMVYVLDVIITRIIDVVMVCHREHGKGSNSRVGIAVIIVIEDGNVIRNVSIVSSPVSDYYSNEMCVQSILGRE